MNRDEILAALKPKTETLALENGLVIVSELSAEAYMDAFRSPLAKNGDEYDGHKFTALLVARSVVDESGARVFTDEDALILRGGANRRYLALATAVKQVNGLIGEDAKN